MKCYAQFYYGSGYATPEADDYEQFASISDVGEALYSRADQDPFYPCVEQSETSALVFLGEPDGMFPCDTDPDYRITIGPRGGIRRERW